ncbi:MAG: PilT/PilU family type 4a pilus ATPase [Nitrospirae bacterium]|nr:PilT/PilU family type 4a pilus ATPase [Nitrospirota bacterium]
MNLILETSIRALLENSPRASDLIFVPGRAPQAQADGALADSPPGLPPLSPEDMRVIAEDFMKDQSYLRAQFDSQGNCDLSFAFRDLCYFRASLFQARQGITLVLRVIPKGVPTLEDLHLPKPLHDIARQKAGLVLVTGATGSGKSSTLAAMIHLINSEQPVHIITVEDPVEFVHTPIKATITQRQLGQDVPTFSMALRAALRQAPQVLLVGEIRDAETAEIAFEAAETGHLVLSTLHTPDTLRTVERFIGLFSERDIDYVRTRFSRAFKTVVSQKLLPRKDGPGRIPAVEILQATLRTQEYVRLGDRPGRYLEEALEEGALEGMQSFDQDLERLTKAGLITLETALAHATRRANLELHLRADEDIQLDRPDRVFFRLKSPHSANAPSPDRSKTGPVVLPLRPKKK